MTIANTAMTLMPALNYVPLYGHKAPFAAVGADATVPVVVSSPTMSAIATVGWAGSIAGMGLGAYHGYKRNHDSIGWGIGWGLLGGVFWPITIPISLVQGLGKPAGGSDLSTSF
jgi:hypothetical protein